MVSTRKHVGRCRTLNRKPADPVESMTNSNQWRPEITVLLLNPTVLHQVRKTWLPKMAAIERSTMLRKVMSLILLVHFLAPEVRKCLSAEKRCRRRIIRENARPNARATTSSFTSNTSPPVSPQRLRSPPLPLEREADTTHSKRNRRNASLMAEGTLSNPANERL